MKDKILNITQHEPTPEQVADGVVNPSPKDWEKIKELLTFDSPPEKGEMVKRALKIAEIARRYRVRRAMVGGAPYFMPILEIALLSFGIEPIYSFSKREVVEVQDGDEVKKQVIFRHVGWVRPNQDFTEVWHE